MQRIGRLLLGTLVFAFIPVTTAVAQGTPQVVTDLIRDVDDVEKKLMGLAKAIPVDKYNWRPAAGVRSVNDVVMHVAADNYLMPAAIGVAPDPATGIKGNDYNTALAFEKRTVTRDQAIAELEKSFAFMRKAMKGVTADDLSKKHSLFGQSFTGQQVLIMATTHLHEHLGQMIAYARSNGIVPPWSQ